MHYTRNEGDHETEEYIAFIYYLLLNADSDSLKFKNVSLDNKKLHSCVFFL